MKCGIFRTNVIIRVNLRRIVLNFEPTNFGFPIFHFQLAIRVLDFQTFKRARDPLFNLAQFQKYARV